MAKTNDVKITVGFTDGTTAELTVNDVDDDSLDVVKTNAQTANSVWTSEQLDNIFVSEGGASSTGVTAVQIVETTSTLIFEGVTPAE